MVRWPYGYPRFSSYPCPYGYGINNYFDLMLIICPATQDPKYFKSKNENFKVKITLLRN